MFSLETFPLFHLSLSLSIKIYENFLQFDTMKNLIIIMRMLKLISSSELKPVNVYNVGGGYWICRWNENLTIHYNEFLLSK